MKNELGIEKRCENCCECAYKHFNINVKCNDLGGAAPIEIKFEPTKQALIKRIKELQEQQFSKEELQFIKRAVSEYSEMSDFDYKPILGKIERSE